MQFSYALQGYWLEKKLQLSKGSIRNYTYALRLFEQFLESPEIESITSLDIKRYLVHLLEERKISKRTANTHTVILSSFFRWVSNELEIANPMKQVPKLRFTVNKIQPFTKAELQQLLSAKQSSKTKAIQLLFLDTGIRLAELCNLKIEDYDPNIGRLQIKSGKGNKDRVVYLGNKTQKVLWKLTYKRTGYLFQTRTGRPFHRNYCAKLVRKLGRTLGIKAHPHKYRHTFAVNFLRNGGNIKQLQEILGHANLNMVNTYLTLSELDLEQARNYSPVDNL